MLLAMPPARAHEQVLTASIFRKCDRDGRRDECLQAILSTTQATRSTPRMANEGGHNGTLGATHRSPL
jgi:hypothetical protein